MKVHHSSKNDTDDDGGVGGDDDAYGNIFCHKDSKNDKSMLCA